MKSTAFVTHSDCSLHDPGWNQPEHQGRLPAVARAVYRDMLTLFEPLLEVEARPASEEDLQLVHSPAYIAEVRQRAEEAGLAGRSQALGEDTMVSGASWDAARAAAGAGITAVDVVLAGEAGNAFCAVRPPGHAARPEAAAAFCIFNNVAIAARHLRDRRDAGRVLVVEWAARPGRATGEILAPDSGVRFLSVHQEESFPGTAWPPNAHPVALPSGTTGSEFQTAFAAELQQLLSGFAPDFILLAAGFDALRADPLGGLSLLPADYYSLTVLLRDAAEEVCAGRLVSVLEGGYEPRAMGEAVVQHLHALAGLPSA